MSFAFASLSFKGKCPKCKTELKHMFARNHAVDNGITDKGVVMCTNCNRVFEVDLDMPNDRMIFKKEVTSKYDVDVKNSGLLDKIKFW